MGVQSAAVGEGSEPIRAADAGTAPCALDQTFTLDVTAALIGSGSSIAVDWIAPGESTPGVAVNATTDPATTLLQLPPLSTTTTTGPTTPGTGTGNGTQGLARTGFRAELLYLGIGLLGAGYLLSMTGRRVAKAAARSR